MALGNDLATILESLGYGTWGGGTTVGATIHLNHEPDAPALCTTLYLTGGGPDALIYDGSTEGERDVQVRFRDPDPVSLQTRAESLYALWAGWRTYPTYYLTVRAATKPLFLYEPEDSNQGNLYVASFNLRVIQGS